MESSYRKGVVLMGPVISQLDEEKWNRIFGIPKEKTPALRKVVRNSCIACGSDLLVEYVDSMNAVTISCTHNRCMTYQKINKSTSRSPINLFADVMNEVYAMVARVMRESGRCPICRCGPVEITQERLELANKDLVTALCPQCGYEVVYDSSVTVEKEMTT